MLKAAKLDQFPLHGNTFLGKNTTEEQRLENSGELTRVTAMIQYT